MQVSYFVSHAGQTYGPWTVSEITQRIAQMELIATDYVFDDGQQSWVPILECAAVIEALRAQKPVAPPASKAGLGRQGPPHPSVKIGRTTGAIVDEIYTRDESGEPTEKLSSEKLTEKMTESRAGSSASTTGATEPTVPHQSEPAAPNKSEPAALNKSEPAALNKSEPSALYKSEPEVQCNKSDFQDASSENAEWFVQRSTHRYGPFTYLGLIKALQEKTIFDYDLVWRRGAGGIDSPEKWIRIAEHDMFTEDAIRKMQTRNGSREDFFFQRRYTRFPMASEVIVHDNQSVWLGQTFQASEGGSGMVIQNALLVPGQVLSLHFTGFDGLPSFNALCEVVNKRYVANIRDSRTTVPYGMKFVKVDKLVQQSMREYTSTTKTNMKAAA